MAMTATSTRSTRRAEGLVAHHHSQHRHLHHHQQQAEARQSTKKQQQQSQREEQEEHQRAVTRHQQQQSNSSRPLKRLHETTNLGYELKPAKKTKFEIEIPSKSQYQARLYPSENIDSSRQQQQQHHHRPARLVAGGVTATHKNPPNKHDLRHQQQQPAPSTAPPPPAAAAPEPLRPASTTAPAVQLPTTAPIQAAPKAAAPATTAIAKKDNSIGSSKYKENKTASQAPSLTKHQEKVVNGIKHELDRLQPSSADMATESQGRKLRSQEGVRFKSELSAYFPEYDEVIGNIPKEEHVLVLDTPIVVVDVSPSASTPLTRREPHLPPCAFAVRIYSDDLFAELNDAHTIDLSWLESQYKGKPLTDPLPDVYYEPIHRKESRNEKITRNAERGRSQHEKEQVIRLLDGLKGPDWLKTMGVTGVTESKKKQFEPARTHFINKCEAVLDKFRKWAAEEKRLKLEKERAARESRESEETESSSVDEDGASVDDEEIEGVSNDGDERKDESEDEDAERGDVEHTDPPESDADAPAKQLFEEAMARSRMAAKSTKRHHAVPELEPPLPPMEFKSFFKKPYQRDAALNKSRRRGRTVMAWGLPLPEIEEREFELPEEFRDEEMMKARERRLRQLRRGSRHRG